jgi:glycosyltransferase involved in cell wall biosynthesis
MIGEEREGQNSTWISKLRNLPNVHFLGNKPYEQLPDYLRGIDVGTLPTLLNDYTRSMFPMKYFEYLAAGIPVVSTPLEFTKNHQAGLIMADEPAPFAAAIQSQLARGRFSPSEARQLVGENTWAGRLMKMMATLENLQQT